MEKRRFSANSAKKNQIWKDVLPVNLSHEINVDLTTAYCLLITDDPPAAGDDFGRRLWRYLRSATP